MKIKNNKNCKVTINDEEVEKYTIKPETADKMFEKLGYEKGSGHNLGNGEKYIYYSGNYNTINLYKKSKKININGSFSMQELQAINRKVLELGWLKKES